MRTFLVRVTAYVLPLLGLACADALDGSTVAWYSSSAGDFSGALPVGNGRLGGMVWGSSPEHIQLNEDSIWSGTFKNRINPAAKSALSQIRNYLQQGNYGQAGNMALANMVGSPTSPAGYQAGPVLSLDLGQSSSSLQNYVRYLDTTQGIVGTNYTYNGVTFSREMLGSKSDGVLLMRLKASQQGALSVKVSMSRSFNVNSNTATASGGVNQLMLQGGSSGLNFAAGISLINTGGQVTTSGSALQVSGATEVDLFIDIQTTYRVSGSLTSAVQSSLATAVSKGYSTVRSNALQAYTSVIGRVKFDLGNHGGGSKPTDQRITTWRGGSQNDLELVTLLFNFGRHALFSSSGDGAQGLPPNLQGIWNEQQNPNWQSKFTVNINIEMNMWPAEVTNMAETSSSVFTFLANSESNMNLVASNMYGCPGYVAHHNMDLWGDSAPVDNGTSYSIWPMGALWLSDLMMEHYHFTGDASFLSNTVWPFYNQLASFYYCYLFTSDGHMQTGPSLSPENPFNYNGGSTGLDIGPTIDDSLLRNLFNNILEMCSVLGKSGTQCSQAQTYLAKLKPVGIGSYGQVLEWRKEYTENQPGMRHLSPLYGLYPGYEMTPAVNQTLANAARTLLQHRLQYGSGDTGWSRAWIIACYARLLDGNSAFSNIAAYITKYPTANLFNTDTLQDKIFQIDGTLGVTGAIAEMLLQSHANLVQLGPALPSSWTGSAKGLAARGAFIADIQFSQGKVVNASITSNKGNKLALQLPNGAKFSVNGNAYSGPISTTQGAKYQVLVTG